MYWKLVTHFFKADLWLFFSKGAECQSRWRGSGSNIQDTQNEDDLVVSSQQGKDDMDQTPEAVHSLALVVI